MELIKNFFICFFLFIIFGAILGHIAALIIWGIGDIMEKIDFWIVISYKKMVKKYIKWRNDRIDKKFEERYGK